MAQTARYHLAGTTDLSNAASWHDGVYGASAVPVVSNVIYFTEGNDNITTGLTGLTTSGFAHCAVTRGFYGRIGSSGTSFELSCHTNGGSGEFGVDGGSTGVEKFIYGAGGGYAYVKADTGGIDVVRSDSNGKLYLTGGTINTRIEAVRGELDINDSVDLSGKTVEIWGGNNVIDWKADGTNPTYNIYGGNNLIRRSGGAITVYGGNNIFQVEKETGISSGAIIFAGGVNDWRAGAMPAAALSFVAGSVTFENAVRPIDLSSATAIVLGNTFMKFGGPAGSKVKWPSPTVVQIKSGFAAEAFARVAADTV